VGDRTETVGRFIAQQIDIITITPPTAQNFNSIHIVCNFIVDLEHINEQATNTSTSTHTVTSALNIAHAKYTEPTAKSITGLALRAAHPRCSIYRRRVIIVKQKQMRARKGLTGQRYRTVIRTISTGGCNYREQKEEALRKRKSLISGCKKREHLYL
jgi:hypothetical protein